MDLHKLQKDYLPMTETAYYILLSLLTPRHGYGIMNHVDQLTKSRVKLGAGTMYGTLSKMEKDGLIVPVAEEDRRKLYKVTDKGMSLLKLEITRLKELSDNGTREMGGLI